MENSLVSIVLPVYNGEKYIAQSIESVLGQTYSNFELIIVNDCSKDKTKEIVEEYQKKDNRIKLIDNKTNQKLPKSLNIGFKSAKGEYFTWTSDDNLFKPKALETMVNLLNDKQDVAFVSSQFDIIDENGDFKGTSNPWYQATRNTEELLEYNNIGACFLYRASVAKEVGEYDPKTFLAEDYDYWLRIAQKGKIYYTEENLYQYRMHSKSLSATRVLEIKKIARRVRLKNVPILAKKIGLPNKKLRKMMFDIKYGYKIKEFRKEMKKAFGISREGERKVVTAFGIKIKFKRKPSKAKKEINYLEKYKLAKKWIEKYTIENKGMAVVSTQPNTIYPECTGYYIPTLLKFGDKKRAVNFGNYLISIQNPDGSWNEPSGKTPYTFDTAQILKGLVALVENNLDENDKYKNALLKGCDYILSMQREDGSISTADYGAWGLPYNKCVPEYIHVYCLEPLRKASKMYNIEKYEACVQKALSFYLSKEDLTDFMTLSHFNAYVIEGLIDLGETKRAKRAMDLISLHQRENGMVPAYSFVDFVCSTGLFQYAICWYKLGELEKANKAFDYACNLQNKSGGFFGSYSVGQDKANYFPEGEIDWAVKYFLDAIYYREKTKYEDCADIFLDSIDSDDERYSLIEKELNDEKYQKILDLGSGKARYTKKLIEKYPNKNFCCMDLSSNVLELIKCNVEKKEGSVLNIPFEDNSFDFIYICEALEHCIDLDNAIPEIARILKPEGKLIVIDKNIKSMGQLKLADFEQWFGEKDLCQRLERNGLKATLKSNLKYEGNRQDGLFSAWIGVKR